MLVIALAPWPVIFCISAVVAGTFAVSFFIILPILALLRGITTSLDNHVRAVKLYQLRQIADYPEYGDFRKRYNRAVDLEHKCQKGIHEMLDRELARSGLSKRRQLQHTATLELMYLKARSSMPILITPILSLSWRMICEVFGELCGQFGNLGHHRDHSYHRDAWDRFVTTFYAVSTVTDVDKRAAVARRVNQEAEATRYWDSIDRHFRTAQCVSCGVCAIARETQNRQDPITQQATQVPQNHQTSRTMSSQEVTTPAPPVSERTRTEQENHQQYFRTTVARVEPAIQSSQLYSVRPVPTWQELHGVPLRPLPRNPTRELVINTQTIHNHESRANVATSSSSQAAPVRRRAEAAIQAQGHEDASPPPYTRYNTTGDPYA